MSAGAFDPYGALLRGFLLPTMRLARGDRTVRMSRSLEPMLFWPRERIDAYRDARLQDLVRHAYETSPFHRRRFDEAGVGPDDIRSAGDLARLPVMTKKDVRENVDELVSEGFVPRDELKAYTGGSTDTPTMFYRDEACLERRRAFTHAFRSVWHGWRPGDRIALVWGAAQDIPDRTRWRARFRQSFLDRTLFLPASVLDERELERIASELTRFAPHVIQAYPSALELVARHALAGGRHRIAPRSIVLTAEPVNAAQRALFRRAFGVDPYSFYGSREFGMAATQCTKRTGLHVNELSVLLEAVDGTRAAQPGEPGRLLVTDLDNRAVPFIRYEIGDSATLAEGHCACGSQLTVIEDLFGRDTDVFVRPDGVYVPGVTLCAGVIAESSKIAQLQIVQHRLDRVTLKIVEGGEFTAADLDALIARVRSFMGDAVELEVERVSEIPRDASGKHRFCISTVGRERLRGEPVSP